MGKKLKEIQAQLDALAKIIASNKIVDDEDEVETKQEEVKTPETKQETKTTETKTEEKKTVDPNEELRKVIIDSISSLQTKTKEETKTEKPYLYNKHYKPE